MTLRIIDNKRIDLTAAEWALYQEICKSYDDDRSHRKGSDLFVGLFETNTDGVIIFLRPPTQKFSSMEVYMFLVGIMVHQHLGTACDQVDSLAQRMIEKEVEHDERVAKKEAVLDKKLKAVDRLLKRGNGIIKKLENVES